MKVKCRVVLDNYHWYDKKLVIVYKTSKQLSSRIVPICDNAKGRLDDDLFLNGVQMFINGNPRKEVEDMVRKDIEEEMLNSNRKDKKVNKQKEIIKQLKNIKFEFEV
ncbi:MAG: hypothetical protein ACRDD7_11865 [Peptostreptococcaceae bacterium]